MDCPIHHRPLECPSCRAAAIGAAGGRAKSDKRAAVAKSLTTRSRKKRKKGQQSRRKREKLQRELRAAEALLARHRLPFPPLGEGIKGDQEIDGDHEIWGDPPTATPFDVRQDVKKELRKVDRAREKAANVAAHREYVATINALNRPSALALALAGKKK